jgi:ATP-dependent protease ClpP protease subunit
MKKWKLQDWQSWAKAFPARNAGKVAAATPIVFRNAEQTDQPLEILIYGEIGTSWWDDSGVSARDFAVALAPIPQARKIIVRINSPGGNVWDGWAIYNLLAARRANVTCVVDGIAASIASVIALAGSECQMPMASMMMIHPASGLCMGTAEEMTEMAAALQKHTDVIAGVYERKSGKPLADVQAKMAAETWFTAPEAKDYGLADTLTDGDDGDDTEPDNKLSAGLVAGGIQNQATKQTPAPAPASGATTSIMNRTKLIALLNKLGIQFEDKATDEQLIALLDNHTPATKPAAPAPDNTAAEDLKAIKADLARRKEGEITARIQACVDSGRLPAGQFAAAVKRAVADESYVTEIEALQPRVIGAEPVNVEVENEDPKTILAGFERFNEPTSAFLRGNDISAKSLGFASTQKGLFFNKHQGRILPFMNSNTVPAGLKRQVIMQEVVRDFARKVLPLRLFATSFGNVPLMGTDKVNVVYYDLNSNASTAFVSGTGYTTIGNTVTATKEITVGEDATDGDRLYSAINFSSRELSQQPYLDARYHAGLIAEKLASDIVADILGIITVVNYGAASVTTPAAAFDSNDVVDLKLACKLWPEMGRALILDSAYDANLLKDTSFKNALNAASDSAIKEGRLFPRVFGFDYTESPTIPGNSENLVGFAAFKSGILAAFAPIPPTEEVRNAGTSYEVVTDPLTGISLEYRSFGNNVTDSATHIVESNYGFAVGNATAIKRITSA